jgi:hypothetical protein
MTQIMSLRRCGNLAFGETVVDISFTDSPEFD